MLMIQSAEIKINMVLQYFKYVYFQFWKPMEFIQTMYLQQ